MRQLVEMTAEAASGKPIPDAAAVFAGPGAVRSRPSIVDLYLDATAPLRGTDNSRGENACGLSFRAAFNPEFTAASCLHPLHRRL
jgi:hypothetical protein